MTKLAFSSGNTLRLLHTGMAFFPALIDAIEQARKDIYLETYIFADDVTANKIRESLCQAAQRGVQVHVVIDWIGSGIHFVDSLRDQLQAAGVNCRIFNPWFKRGLARAHRKLCVVDQERAFIGGINLIDDLTPDNGSSQALPFPRWDFSVEVRGSLVVNMYKEVSAQWLKIGHLRIIKRLQLARDLRKISSRGIASGAQAALIIRDNLRNRNTIQKAYLKALGMATHTAIIANPYFAPGRKMRNGLISAAQRGVQVSLLLGIGEFELQDAIAQSYYERLLRNGVRIYEYNKTKLHAKAAVIDDDWVTVGSSNFDGLSLFINHEANIVVKDQSFALELTHHLQQGIRDAVEITLDTHVKQSLLKKIRNRFAFWTYRLLMRMATLGKYR